MGASLLALDWGSTNLRAGLLDQSGRTLAERQQAAGILQVPQRNFEQVLFALCGDWLQDPSVAIIASGMIGSRQGWVEAPYLATPITPTAAAQALTRIPLRGDRAVYLIPGIRSTVHDSTEHIDDVMRGEETQVWGADIEPGSIVVLPGTHSKWVHCGADGAIDRFQTWMTGELFAVLGQHSILGRLIEPGDPSEGAFTLGVQRTLAAPEALSTLLFSVRTAGLMSRIAPTALSDYLSGLLIGAEVASALRRFNVPREAAQLSLIGEPSLCDRYARALAIAGVQAQTLPSGLAARGAWRLACAAGLIRAAEV
ncbi:MAG: 2-dehydro-3-deoxygalactonokinase [Betaproteobacteria bacterium]|nr:2-dehydro-3-deoxygalactonokinase [Betaproteobacteria bacterium]